MVSQIAPGHKNPGRTRRLYKAAAKQTKQANGQTKVAQAKSGRSLAFSILFAVASLVGGPAAAASDNRGAVTNLPLPRYVSLKASEGNVRRGPSRAHRIDWVFKRRDMPLMITAEHGHWRRVQDRDGAGGWVHYALLSGVRTVLIEKDMVQARNRPDAQAPVSAMFELGVVARLGDCTPEWCRISAGGYRGWVRKSALWGVAPDEIRD